MKLRLEITDDGAYTEYPYRVRGFDDVENKLLFEDDYMSDLPIGKLFEQIKRQIEEPEL